jgi:branched-chain amino acid transport system permease protein
MEIKQKIRSLQKPAFVAVWMGLLTLPFLGVSGSVKLAAVLLAGSLLFFSYLRWVRSALFQNGLAGLQRKYRLLFAGKEVQGVRQAGMVLLVTLLLALPPLMNDYYIDVLTLAGIYVVLALGLNVVVGMAGLLDLGYVAFYAVGAYTYAILSTRYGLPFWPALPIGGAAAALVGVFLGVITLRLRGDYLAIVTLGFLMIVHLVLNNWDELTHGPNGILGIPNPSIGGWTFSQPIHFYYLILILVFLIVFVAYRLMQSRIGRAWIAIREDEMAASAMGIPVTRMKILAFALGASWAGIAGVFFAGRYAFVSPESFTFFETVFVLSMVVLGGMGSIPGVILGALLLVILPEVFRGFQDYRMLAFGGAMVLMMAFRPQGLIGNPRRKIELREEKV